MKGITAAVIGTAYVTQQLSVHGRAGIFFAESKSRINLAVGTFRQSDEFTDDTENLFFGLGAGLDLNDQFTLTLDFTRYQVGDAEREEDDHVDAAQLGFIYRIR